MCIDVEFPVEVFSSGWLAMSKRCNKISWNRRSVDRVAAEGLNTSQYWINYRKASAVCSYWLRDAHGNYVSHGYVVDIVLKYCFSHSNIASERNPITISRKYGKGRDTIQCVHFDERVVVHTVPHWDPSRTKSFNDVPASQEGVAPLFLGHCCLLL